MKSFHKNLSTLHTRQLLPLELFTDVQVEVEGSKPGSTSAPSAPSVLVVDKSENVFIRKLIYGY